MTPPRAPPDLPPAHYLALKDHFPSSTLPSFLPPTKKPSFPAPLTLSPTPNPILHHGAHHSNGAPPMANHDILLSRPPSSPLRPLQTPPPRPPRLAVRVQLLCSSRRDQHHDHKSRRGVIYSDTGVQVMNSIGIGMVPLLLAGLGVLHEA